MTSESKSAVFDLKDLNLGYKQGELALKVDRLKFHRGQLSFVLGPSGAGKSTLLETLGLMRNTILGGERLSFQAEESNASLLSIWKDGGQEANELRNQHFSFIFQSTNLMPNFTLGENICFAGMLNGKTIQEVKPKALALMEDLNLDAQLFDHSSSMASGGQRQRAAFVRALCKDFDVLFGDEPTGNLDKSNAVNLFETLKSQIKSKNKTAIIVSHDEELAERFADDVIRIGWSTEQGPRHGLIS